MRKVILLILLAVNNSAMAGSWKYQQLKDEMRGTVSKIATKESINTVNFKFPYTGKQRGTLMVMNSKEVLFYVRKGQVICQSGSEYGTCLVLIKFDDGEAEYFNAKKIGDDSTTIAITENSFIAKLKNAKKIMLQVEIFQNGYPVFKFDVSGLKVEDAVSVPIENKPVQQITPITLSVPIENKPVQQITPITVTDAELSEMASQVNSKLPLMINNETRLDNVVGKTNKLTYNHTLINTPASMVTEQMLKAQLEKSLVQQVCTTKVIVDTIVSRGVTISYRYYGKDGGLIGDISITPSQCVTNMITPTSGINKAAFGVQCADLPASIALSLHRENLKAALVLVVNPNSVADKSGIKVGDIILEFDGKPIEKFADLQKVVSETELGRKVLVKLIRVDKDLNIDAQF